MRTLNISGIRQKVLVVAVIPAATVTLLLTLYFSLTQTYGLEESLKERGLAIIRQLGPASEYGVYSGNPDILRPLVRAVMNEADVRAVSIHNTAGVTVISAGPTMDKAFVPEDAGQNTRLPDLLATEDGKSWIFKAPIFQTEFIGDEFFEAGINNSDSNSEQLSQTDRILGWVLVELSLARTQAYQLSTWTSASLIALVVLIISAVLAMRLGRSISSPITALKGAVDRLENGDFEVEVNTGTSGELQSLEIGINDMAKTLKAYRANLEEQINQATAELRETLKVLEERNTELNVARMEAESANVAKSSFLANISHEIRTPLNGIHGFLMLLSKANLDPQHRDYVDKIYDSTKMLLTLLNDILDFSKLEVSRLNIVEKEFNIRELLDESICIGIPEADSKGLGLILIVDEDIPSRLTGGADRIAQGVKNLVSNAVKFTAQGEVLVRASIKTRLPEADLVQISVSDTGIGISQQDRLQLFQPFSQIENGMNRRYSGTGLGLVITKSLIELMDGNITVDSAPEKGSRFTVTLPLKRANPSGTDREREKILSGKRALVVSPNRNLNRSIKQMLRHWRVDVATVSKTAMAIELLGSSFSEGKPHSVIIVDGIISGDEIREIVNYAESGSVTHRPCLILLDHVSSESHVDSALRQKFFGILSRPPRTSVLADLLCQIFLGSVVQPAHNSSASTFVSAPAGDGQQRRVLVADDNAINRQFLSTWLKQSDVIVEEVADGAEAINICQNTKYDLILMDLHMPNVDGLDASRHIKASGRNRLDTPIIAITADATEESRRKIRQSGLDGYLVKPVDEEQLRHLLEKWCPRNPQAESSTGSDFYSRSGVPDKGSIIDVSQGIRLASGDTELWRWSVQTLLERMPDDKSELQQALHAGDFQRAGQLAHRIIGAASYCGANELLQAAKQLQQAARDADITVVENAYHELSAAMSHLSEWADQEIGHDSA